jgi:hypothetical protein
MYRAKPVTQRDGGPLANSNCRMASAATGLDFDTLGKKTSTGSKMRARSGDPSGGTTASDAARAWDTYDEVLSVQNGKGWDDVIASLKAGRLVHLDVWAATCGGPCCKSACGHTLVVAPEQHSDGRWLVSDPWCRPAKWTWWAESKLRKGAEEWADRCGWRASTKGLPRDIRNLTVDELRNIVKGMVDLWFPGHPLHPEDDDYEPATFGVMPTLWTRTDAHPDEGAVDMAIQSPTSLGSDYVLPVKKGTSWYKNGDLTGKYGEFSSDRELPYVGVVIDGDSRAVIVKTSKPYPDGEDKPTVVYVKQSAGEPKKVPPSDDAARDKQWRDWLDGMTQMTAYLRRKTSGGTRMVEERSSTKVDDSDVEDVNTVDVGIDRSEERDVDIQTGGLAVDVEHDDEPGPDA